VWAYYTSGRTRVFKVEAEEVLDTPFAPGADYKRVARRIRLIEEVQITGNENTGYQNTGNGNTGNENTGYQNTGNGNTGNGNTGYRNTGNGNTGNRNTGNGNTGNRNTGNRNTGNGNTGYGNTGNGNTGYGNTGNGNTTDRATGFFCQAIQTVKSFDVETGLSYEEFLLKYPCVHELGRMLAQDEGFDYAPFTSLPGFDPIKLTSLHQKHIAGRKSRQGNN
jgi:hypothetical protein